MSDRLKRLKEIPRHYKIYAVTVLGSLLLLLVSAFDDGFLGNLLMGIGCSAITAAMLAFFIEIGDDANRKKHIESMRSACLEDIYYQTRTLIERIIWFDKCFDEIDFDEANEYFFSWEAYIKFAKEHDKYYEIIPAESIKNRLKALEEKYSLENIIGLDDERYNHVGKMFQIIGEASEGFGIALQNLSKNRIQYMGDGIFTVDEISRLLGGKDMVVEWLKTPDSNYGGAISFVLSCYNEIEPYMEEKIPLFISWKSKYPMQELFFKNKQNSNTDKEGHLINN